MKVLISWSGNRSKEVAIALRSWLKLILYYVEPWMSEQDIQAGDRWADVLRAQLKDAKFGIICVTRDNIASSWMLFEAGALSKSLDDETKVVPFLFDLDTRELSSPLSLFQAKKAERE